MIAIDTSSAIAYFSGAGGTDVSRLDLALEERHALFPPLVISELLSDHTLSDSAKSLISALPMLDLYEGYWQRVGSTRAKILRRGLKARTADSSIAQSCIDHGLPLLTRDKDFRHFVRLCGLRLAST